MKCSYSNTRSGERSRSMRKLIIDGNAVYELDENCMLKKKLSEKNEDEEEKKTQNKKVKK